MGKHVTEMEKVQVFKHSKREDLEKIRYRGGRQATSNRI